MEVTLLSEEQVYGEDNLKIFDEYGFKATITDFAILLGGKTLVDNSFKGKYKNTSWWWTRTIFPKKDCIRCVHRMGTPAYGEFYKYEGGIRPTINSLLDIMGVNNNLKIKKGVLEIEYGEYPQFVVSKSLKLDLEYEYLNKSLIETGKCYTANYINPVTKEYKGKKYTEYEYKGKRYIRFIANDNRQNVKLSSGDIIEEGKTYWIEVEPIIWLFDMKKDVAITKNLLLSGMPFDSKKEYDGNFENTFLYKFLNIYFIKDIEVRPEKIELNVIKQKSKRELDLEKLEKDKQKILNLRRNLGK